MWQKTRYSGIETEALPANPESRLLTVLTKMAPGDWPPDDEHVLIEQMRVVNRFAARISFQNLTKC